MLEAQKEHDVAQITQLGGRAGAEPERSVHCSTGQVAGRLCEAH